MIRRKPLPRSTSPILRRVRPRKVNPKRRKSEFARCYGSKARVEFVKSLPCAACGVVGYSENAHLLGNGGMSRKGHYTEIGPLCGPQSISRREELVGCHTLYDEYRWDFNERFPVFDPNFVAADTQRAWASSVLEDTK